MGKPKHSSQQTEGHRVMEEVPTGASLESHPCERYLGYHLIVTKLS